MIVIARRPQQAMHAGGDDHQSSCGAFWFVMFVAVYLFNIYLVTMFLFMVALWHRADHYIFILFLLSFFFFISSPNLSGQRLNVYHTSAHGVALVRI